MNLLRMLAQVVKQRGNVVIIHTEGEEVQVNTGNKSKREIKTIATLFFKEAHKLQI